MLTSGSAPSNSVYLTVVIAAIWIYLLFQLNRYFIWCYSKFVTNLFIYAACNKHTTSKLLRRNSFDCFIDFYAGMRRIADLLFIITKNNTLQVLSSMMAQYH